MRPGERRGVVEVLGRAFVDDPVACFLFPRDADRARRFARLTGLEIDAFADDGLVFTTESVEGAAIWKRPEPRGPGTWRRVSVSLRMIALMGRGVSRAARVGELLASRAPKRPHYYLATLGTDPPARGRGLGAALMAPVLARCDQERTPAYLESSKASNVPFYERHGFEVVERIEVPGGPPLWTMLRPPRGAGASGGERRPADTASA